MSCTGQENEAFKLMISDVAKAEDITGGLHHIQLSSHKACSSSSSARRTLSVKLIWIQGDLAHITQDPDDGSRMLIINDGTGQAIIAGSDAIPGGNHGDIKIGAYIGVLGQILTTKPDIVINAIKIMVLKSKPLLKEVWKDEVSDLKAFLLGQYDESWIVK